MTQYTVQALFTLVLKNKIVFFVLTLAVYAFDARALILYEELLI